MEPIKVSYMAFKKNLSIIPKWNFINSMGMEINVKVIRLSMLWSQLSEPAD